MRPMAFALSIAVPVAIAFAQPMAMPIDVSKLIVGAPASVADLDLGKLKGDLRQIAWSPDDARLYLQTAEPAQPSERLHHYTIAIAGEIVPVDAQPDWAIVYWQAKSDRTAPGVPSVQIEVKQESTNQKIGTGSGRPGTFDGGAGGYENAAMGSEGQKLPTVRFLVFGQTISEFVNERPIPGLMFGWGPRGTGALAFTDRQGKLTLLDQESRKRVVLGVKDAVLPAWSTDGTRLAWAQKTGRRKYTVMVAAVSKG